MGRPEARDLGSVAQLVPVDVAGDHLSCCIAWQAGPIDSAGAGVTALHAKATA